MNEEIYDLLPTLQQKLVVLLLTCSCTGFLIWMVWKRRLREEHALLWFLGLALGTLIVWNDSLLTLFAGALGIDLPAHALILVALFFLLGLSMWLSSVASRNKQGLERLVIETSILRCELEIVRSALEGRHNNTSSR